MKRPEVSAFKRITRTAPSSSVHTNSILASPNNSQITNNTISVKTENIYDSRPSALDALHKRVAPNAILNAGGRADEVRCHPGTREEVIRQIEEWRGSRGSQTAPILWLSGPAGAGKTAIMQTIAERCKEHNAPQANFFFFRADTSRNSLTPLVATLVHQIILLYPNLRELVVDVLSTNPLTLDATLEEQLMQLIVTPLQTIRHSPYLTPLLLIDGLDECDSEEEKLSQRQILQAFHKIVTEHPCPFRLLVASRNESQIQTEFNDISASSFLSLYLDDQYKPDYDIRTFVVDKFKKIRETHPLAHTLVAPWPSDKDVEDIVNKSSGQFIYAATVMRFIIQSGASPQLSLERVHGAARIVNNKSPFSFIDAIYTYILSRVDEQDILREILHAQLFLQTFGDLVSPGIMAPLLEAYNPEYTQEVVLSCMADLTPIAQYTEDGKVLFYHASFPDYLQTSWRSNGYVVDLHAFNFRIQSSVWKARANKGVTPADLHHIAFKGLLRLSELPDGLLDAVIALQEAAFIDGDGACVAPFDMLTHLHSLCNSDDHLTKYKLIVSQWAKDSVFDRRSEQFWRKARPKIWPPYVLRHIAMSDIEARVSMAVYRSDSYGSHDVDLHYLIPDRAADFPDITTWLSTLLHHIHKEKYRTSVSEYNQLVRKWSAWAVHNNIPLNEEDLPNARWYRAMAHIERDLTTNIPMYRERDCNVSETADWLATLLRRIHEEKYGANNAKYNQFLRRWTAWAVQSNIPLYEVDNNLPNFQWYSAIANIDRDVTNNIALVREEDCNIPETAAWLTTLLRRIHSEKYHNDVTVYNQLVRSWTSWATLNDIPLNNVDDLPNTQWYLTMAEIDRDVMTDAVLTRGEGCDVSETATWLMSLLRRIHTEKYDETVKQYNQLMRKWIAWAACNEIPLYGLDELPNAQWYCAMAKIERDVTSDIPLYREQDCDVPETSAWLVDLLHHIRNRYYHNNVEEYNRLLKKWTSWAIWNDIPLEGVDGLPQLQRYLRKSKRKKWLANNFGLGSRPE